MVPLAVASQHDSCVAMFLGRWTVRVLYKLHMVAETMFHITPLSHHKRVALTSNQALRVHRGPAENMYLNSSFNSFVKVLKLKNVEEHQRIADKNALKTDAALLQWIDALSGALYSVSETCIVENGSGVSACPEISRCKQTKWSSKSPDPKSELGDIDPLTKMFER